MRFRQVKVVKRDSTKSLLPLKVTYEAVVIDGEDEEEDEEYNVSLVSRAWQGTKSAILSRYYGDKSVDIGKDEDNDSDDEIAEFTVRFFDRSDGALQTGDSHDDHTFHFNGYVLSSGLAKAIKVIAPYAVKRLPILIQGEAGTGKATLARAIHASSGVTGPFITVNCANLSLALFSRLLNGTRVTKGLLDQAEHGVLYLANVETLSLDMQDTLIEALERVFPYNNDDSDVNEDQAMPLLVSSCNLSIKKLLADKLFKRPLYRRLKNGFADLPSLRMQPEVLLPLLKSIIGSEGTPKTNTQRIQLRNDLLFARDVAITLTRMKLPRNYADLQSCADQLVTNLRGFQEPITGQAIREWFDGTSNQRMGSEETVSQGVQNIVPGMLNELDSATTPKNTGDSGLIRLDKQSGPVIGISMSRAWEKEHDREFQRLRLDQENWKCLILDVEIEARKLCDSMLLGESGVLKKALKENWKAEFKRVLIARWVILVMEKHEPTPEVRLHKLGWLPKDAKGKDSLKCFESYRQYCYQLGFVQPKQGNILEKSYVWPEEQAWLDKYEPPR